MNMSRQYSGPYYHLFGPRSQEFGQPNPPFRQPSFPPYSPRDYNPMYPPSFPPPQIFAEYSLWGDSSYNPTDLIRTNSGIFGNPSPPYPPRIQQNPSAQFQPDCPPPNLPECIPPDVSPESLPPEVPPEYPEGPEPVFPLDIVSLDDDMPVVGSAEPELTGLEELDKLVIDKEDLYRCSDSESSDVECISDDDPDTADQSSNSSGSSNWTNTNFLRASYPSSYPWASRPARVVNNRGRKANIMQRRLVRALSQPVKFDKGASMMQRMGWMGGGLGRDGSGIVNPIEPNAIYATSTAGFGQDTLTKIKRTEKTKMPKTTEKTKTKLTPGELNKKRKELFMTNVLELIVSFVKNDLILEMYFDTKLNKVERKRVVAALTGDEDSENLSTIQQQEAVNEIHRRNKYILNTQSEGEGDARQICVFKSAPNHMFLVTPDDCRPCITEIKEMEEENPFMKSITKHIRPDTGTVLQPRAPHLFDKLVEFFIDYCTDELFTEFRFLGPFTRKELYVINNFFSLIGDLSRKKKPFFKVPVELLDVFASPDLRFHTDSAPNGFTAISKEPFSLKKEFEKQEEEKRKKRALDHHPANLLAREIFFSKIT